MNRFWIVLADRNVLSAAVRHNSRSDAQSEAMRLATKHPTERFFVAAVTGIAQAKPPTPIIPEIIWVELKNPK